MTTPVCRAELGELPQRGVRGVGTAVTGKKYGPLNRLLLSAAERGSGTVLLYFDELAELVGGLPASAYRRPSWWANGYLVQAVSWRSAGFRVARVDLAEQWVRFERHGRA